MRGALRGRHAVRFFQSETLRAGGDGGGERGGPRAAHRGARRAAPATPKKKTRASSTPRRDRGLVRAPRRERARDDAVGAVGGRHARSKAGRRRRRRKNKNKNVRPGDGVRVFENRRHHVGVRVFSLVARITRCVSRPRRPWSGGHRDQPRVAERAASVLRLRGASARRVGVAGGAPRSRAARASTSIQSRPTGPTPTSREMRLPLRRGGRASRAVAGRRGRARARGVRARARAVGAALAASDGRAARVFK